MSIASPAFRLFVGVDIAAATCVVACKRGGDKPTRAITINQTASGFAELQRQLTALEPDPSAILVVMEATGTNWMRLATFLIDAGFAVSVINPAQAHNFARRSSSTPRPMRLTRGPWRNSRLASSRTLGHHYQRSILSCISAWRIAKRSSVSARSSAPNCTRCSSSRL